MSAEALGAWDSHLQHFSQLFSALIKLDDKTPPHTPSEGAFGGVWEKPLPLPLEMMVKPLKKRFRYHFMEDRKTNSLEKVSLTASCYPACCHLYSVFPCVLLPI
jgi:hypothetical protein